MLTADGQFRGGREIPLKPAVDEALAMGGCESIKSVVVYRRTGTAVQWEAKHDVWLHDLVNGQPDTCEPTWVNAEHPLFILYTSGSTGKPKGIQHSTGGYLLWTILTMKWVFDYKPADVFWCTADVGWARAFHTTYGPSPAARPRSCSRRPYIGRGALLGIYSDQRLRYLPAPGQSLIIKDGGDLPRIQPSSLRIRTVGEPIKPGVDWYHRPSACGRLPIVTPCGRPNRRSHDLATSGGNGPSQVLRVPATGIFADIVTRPDSVGTARAHLVSEARPPC